MDDYISKEDAVEALHAQYNNCTDASKRQTIAKCAKCVAELPAADVVSVIRCKDCRWYALKQSSICDMHCMAVLSSDYCSYAVRKEA